MYYGYLLLSHWFKSVTNLLVVQNRYYSFPHLCVRSSLKARKAEIVSFVTFRCLPANRVKSSAASSSSLSSLVLIRVCPVVRYPDIRSECRWFETWAWYCHSKLFVCAFTCSKYYFHQKKMGANLNFEPKTIGSDVRKRLTEPTSWENCCSLNALMSCRVRPFTTQILSQTITIGSTRQYIRQRDQEKIAWKYIFTITDFIFWCVIMYL